MKRYQVKWGWNPPLYDKPNGGFRLFYTKERRTDVSGVKDKSSDESKMTEHTYWLCDVVEYSRDESADFLKMLKEGSKSKEFRKLVLCTRMEAYADSHHIKEFLINGKPVWLDSETRSKLLLRFQAELAEGATDTVIWYKGERFCMGINEAVRVLYAVEVYSSKCYDNLQKHKLAAATMTRGFETYDYKSGYPDRLSF